VYVKKKAKKSICIIDLQMPDQKIIYIFQNRSFQRKVHRYFPKTGARSAFVAIGRKKIKTFEVTSRRAAW
jgi:hypothetical protein